MILKIFLLPLAIPIIIALVALGSNSIPLPDMLDDSRNQIGAVAAGTVSFLYLIGLLIFSIVSFRNAGRKTKDLP